MERYVGPGSEYTPKDLLEAIYATNRDIVILGDSLSRQWFEELSCYLGAFDAWPGFATPPINDHRGPLETEVTESFLRFRTDYRSRYDGNMGDLGFKPFSRFGAYELPLPEVSKRGGDPLRVIYSGVQRGIEETMDFFRYYDLQYPKNFRRKRPIFVINIGLHYNWGQDLNRHGNPRSEKDLKANLYMIMRYCQNSGARCIIRESSPQHFDTDAKDGVFPLVRTHPNVCMEQPPATFDQLSRWRNDVLYDVINGVLKDDKQVRGRGVLTVMPLFDKLLGLSKKHRRTYRDCTHFKSDPEIWEPWHVSLTEVLTDFARPAKVAR